MNLNKYRYKIVEEPRKMYFDCETEELKSKLDIAFAKTVKEDETTGILGKYKKHSNRYKIKYIYSRNAELQPKTFERYFVLAETGADESGAYIEYALVYDKLFEPLVRISYILTVLLIISCFMTLMQKGLIDKTTAYTLSLVSASTVIVIFKKSKETAEESKKTLKIFEKLLKKC